MCPQLPIVDDEKKLARNIFYAEDDVMLCKLIFAFQNIIEGVYSYCDVYDRFCMDPWDCGTAHMLYGNSFFSKYGGE